MNRIIIPLLLLGVVVATSCRKSEEPAPQAITFQLSEAELNGNAIIPLPFYQLTLHFDAAGVPSEYEVVGNHPASPTPAQQGTWTQNGTQITFYPNSANESLTVNVRGMEVSVLSSQIQISWSLDKTEIIWEQVGDYIYTLQRMD